MEPLEEVPTIAAAPPAPAVPWQRLDPRVIQLRRAIGWIAFAVVLLVYTAFLAIVWLAVWFRDEDIAPWLAIGLSVPWPFVAGLLAWLAQRFPEVDYRYTTWRIDDVGLAIRTGVVWRKEISVARSRVQHIDVSQGPMERRYGLATLTVYTAGTEHSEIGLDGLEHGVALAARDALLPASDVDAV